MAFVADVLDAGTPHLPSVLISNGEDKIAIGEQLTAQWTPQTDSQQLATNLKNYHQTASATFTRSGR